MRHETHTEALRRLLHGKSPYQSLDKQTHYLENVKRELEARHAKQAHIAYHKEWADHQKKMNYNIELHRLHGYLSQNQERLGHGTKHALQRKIHHLEKLGGQFVNHIV